MRYAILLAIAALIAGGAWLYTPDVPRAVLTARYGTAADTDLDVAGIRLRVRDTGPRDAPPVILMHGFGSSLETWEAWAGRLVPGHRVIRYDLPGFGLTGADPAGDYSEGRGVAVLSALMDRLGLAQASLVGNSMGGKLAWEFAAAHPARVARLVLVSPDGFASPGFAYDTPPEVPLMMQALPYVLPAVLLRATLAPAYGDSARLTDATVARYRDMMRAPGVRRAIIDRLRQVRLADPRVTLSRVTMPVLLLWGVRDAMIPVRNAADYLSALPDARLVELPGLGHVPFEEEPDVSLEPALAFLHAGERPPSR